MEERIRGGGGTRALDCLRATCCTDPDSDEGKCTLPAPKRSAKPVSDGKFELLECFPYYFEATWLLNKFPCVKWLLRYNPRWLLADIIAGLTVGLMVVPQALAYATIARLPHSYGLYSAFMGCFIYTIFGTSKDITLGPTAILSLLTASLTWNCGPGEDPDDTTSRIQCAVALTFLSGAIQFAVGLLNLGFLVDFIPFPVISGFTSAAAITIAFGQIKSLLGIHHIRRPFVEEVGDIFRHIKETKIWDLVLGLCCIVLVVALKFVKSHVEKLEKNRGSDLHIVQKICLRFIRLLCTARNALVVFVAALIAYSLTLQSWFDGQISLIDYNNGALPPLQVPDPTSSVCSILGIGIVMGPLISFLESIAIAKAFARQNGYEVEPSQELVAIGMCNLASSFVGSYPVTGSFSRTAVNAQSGVKTPAAGIITGGIVLLALAALSSLFQYIPSASLAAIIIAAVIPVVDVRVVWTIFRVNVIDVIPLAVSFCFTLFLGIEYGVPLAMVVYVLILLYRHARPRHKVKVCGTAVIFEFNGGWTYPGVNYILRRVSSEITTSSSDIERQRTKYVVFDCKAMPEIDFTIIQELKKTCKDLMNSNIQVYFIHVQDHVRTLLEKGEISNIQFSESLDAVLEGEGFNHVVSVTTPLRGISGSMISEGYDKKYSLQANDQSS